MDLYVSLRWTTQPTGTTQMNAVCGFASWTVTYECVQIMGGMGFMKVRCLRNAFCSSVLRTLIGTNVIIWLFVALNGFQVTEVQWLICRILGSISPLSLGELVNVMERQTDLSVKLLLNHRKNEQFVLKRVVDWAFVLCAMVVFLSRASRSLSQGHLSAQRKKCETWCNGDVQVQGYV
uniref:ACAD9/ACADV-like C-terminal domain-containing protein n=1 Tax=Oncorhynchus kisutch TaxID=8019 RepID=A0A8C7DAS5_ONCKI